MCECVCVNVRATKMGAHDSFTRDMTHNSIVCDMTDPLSLLLSALL